MSKDAYYFSHDSNAKDDPKCMILIEELGLEGYGAFWVLIETLRDQNGYRAPIRMIPGLARRYNTTAEKMKAVVLRYNLFVIENECFFYSPSLINRMKPLAEKRRAKKVNSYKGNLIKYKHVTREQLDELTDDEIIELGKSLKDRKTITLPRRLLTESEGSPHALPSKVEESKVKESTSNQNKIEESEENDALPLPPPTEEEVKDFFSRNGGNGKQAISFYLHFKTYDWQAKNGRKIRNWKARGRKWIVEDSQKATLEVKGQNVPPPPGDFTKFQKDDEMSDMDAQLQYFRSELKGNYHLTTRQINDLLELVTESNYKGFLDSFYEIKSDKRSEILTPEQVYQRIKDRILCKD